jgi:hypothetical protein
MVVLFVKSLYGRGKESNSGTECLLSGAYCERVSTFVRGRMCVARKQWGGGGYKRKATESPLQVFLSEND